MNVFAKKNKEQFIMLDEECFRCLVRGGVVSIGHLRIGLADMGFVRMLDAIDAGTNLDNQYIDYVKE